MSSHQPNIDLLNDIGPRISELVSNVQPRLIEIRRDLHANPELGFETIRTAKIVADELTALGLHVRTGIGRSGVVAEIVGQYPGPCVIIRADMDALPIEEATGLPFASKVQGSMHACGHDLYTASLLGAAMALTALKSRLRGNVRLVSQAAEEIAESGAASMISDGAAEGGDFAIGFHNMPDVSAGKVQLTRGASTASSDEFKVVLRGISGHAARPHLAEDPIVAAAYMIAQLQTIVARQVDPADSAVLTVGCIHGGRTQNIIPDACLFEGTVRCRSPQARDIAEQSFVRICNGAAQAMNVAIHIDYVRGVPGVINDDALVARATEALTQHFGEAPRVEVGRDFGGEDFAYFSERMPSIHINIGSGQPGRTDRLHNSNYQPDEACIAKSAEVLTRMAVDLLA